ncbi:hypothetical protein L1987_84578 [Smallanthus sonchifolius]|uniref:Uncharacterized protein n=1 Tax=Smallanthus sonchifolius TaxID=185202 RepID=A0ACB8XUR7_9ASTR|nr:hypothetical protein L1987_84578 [Smallanthus sonchifolius]
MPDGTREPGEAYNREHWLRHDYPVVRGSSLQATNLELEKTMDFAFGSGPSVQQDPFQAVQSVWNSPCSSNQVFTDLGGKQKTAAPAAKQVSKPQCVGPGAVPGPTSYKPQNMSSGFNYSRAVQGDKGSRKQQPAPPPVGSNSAELCPVIHPTAPKNPSINSTSHCSSMDIDTSNRFSVLDIPNSIKFNKLVESHDDLYPPDHGMGDDMDVEVSRSKSNDTEFCHLNREHADGSRILPESILSPPKSGGTSSSIQLGPGCSAKSYGISVEQKKVIANRLKNVGSVSVDLADQWCPGNGPTSMTFAR